MISLPSQHHKYTNTTKLDLQRFMKRYLCIIHQFCLCNFMTTEEVIRLRISYL